MAHKIANDEVGLEITPPGAQAKIEAASQPTVTGSGQVFRRSVRDVLFSPSRIAAAETLRLVKTDGE